MDDRVGVDWHSGIMAELAPCQNSPTNLKFLERITMPQLRNITHLLETYRKCREKIIDAQNCIFDLHLNEELEKIHSILNSLDEKIDGLELLLKRQLQAQSAQQKKESP